MHLFKRLVRFPGRILLISIIATIVLGTVALSSTKAQTTPHALIDIIFMATSATCITGLTTIPLHEFTPFGHGIILLLIQIGGLGLITLTVFLISLFFHLGLEAQFMTGRLLEIDNWKNSRSLLTFIILFTLGIELLGACALYCALPAEPIAQHSRWFFALFHKNTAFCSAGIGLIPFEQPVIAFNSLFLTVLAVLMFIGGLGFIVWQELLHEAYNHFIRKRVTHFSLHSKIVISVTLITLCSSLVLLWFLEQPLLTTHSWFNSSITVVFNALSYRSPGFTTLTISTLSNATLFLIMIISFIGSSPGSTGSGIKTTTFALFLAAIRAVMQGRTYVEIKMRRIPNDQVFKAMAVLSLSLSWVCATTFILLISENAPFLDTFFEVLSAFANLGLSMGLTTQLSFFGKLMLILSMLVGRIGSVTLLLALRRRREKVEINYPEERILIS